MTLGFVFFMLIACQSAYAPDGFRDQSPSTPQSQFVEFPKILWTYWSTGLDNAKIWTKLCLNNLHHFSMISGYELRFLTDQNYTNYLSTQNNKKMQDYVNLLQKNRLGIQAKSDLLRNFLMYQHGGMYLDANSFLTRDLGWISKLYEWPWIYNRISPNPQVLLFTQRKDMNFQGKLKKVFDHHTNQYITLVPGFQAWFMLAKPNSLFYTKMIENIGISLQLGYEGMVRDHRNRGIEYWNEFSNYFLLANFQIAMVISLKQAQLDAAESPITKYAVDYYKLWTMYSESSGYFFYLNFLHALGLYALPSEFSQQETDDYFQYDTRLLLIKSTGVTTREFQQKILGIYNKTCVEVSHQMRPQSLLYQSLINISSIFPEVDSLKKTLEYNEGKCGFLSQETDNIELVLAIFKYMMIAAIIGLVMIVSVPCVLRLDDRKNNKND